jgi:uncharacterized protein
MYDGPCDKLGGIEIMPLLSGHSEATRSKNIAELIKSGFPAKQAEAIAYKKSGKDSTSKREYDLNGWPEIKDNPISKVGIFDYLGSQIDPDGELGLQQDRIYKIYRPAEELSDPECIDSFRLLPWTDDHAMLGSTDGLTHPEKKGIHGVIGENVHFADGYLKANIKVFSTKMAQKIEDGKKELSIGYRCLYDIQSGVYDGENYDGIQREIRGNHIALVDEGRSGPDVAVLDHFKITFDAKELKMPDKEKKTEDEGESMESLKAECKKLRAELAKVKGKGKKSAEDVEPEDFVKKAHASEDAESDEDDDEDPADTEDGDGEEKKPKSKEKEEPAKASKKESKGDPEEGTDKKKKKSSMDEKLAAVLDELRDVRENGMKLMLEEVANRDALVKKLIPVIGVFDHKLKTLKEVQKYAVDKLELPCTAGHEGTLLDGYFAAHRVSTGTGAMDSANKPSNVLDTYLKECS